MARRLILLPLLALAGCGGADDGGADNGGRQAAPAAARTATSPATPAPASSSRPSVALRSEDFPQLASRDCVDVAQFALEAIGAHEFARAALAWNSSSPTNAAAIAAAFGSYATPEFTWAEPVVEGAAGSLYCTVTATLKDAGDPTKPAVDGTLLLRRLNDVDGATPEQLRWTVRSSTFLGDPPTGG